MDLENKDDRHKYMIKKLRMDIAYNVRLIRIQHDWTQDQLAERCHTEQPAISQVENWNAEFPSTDTLKRIAEAFDCGLMIRFDGWEEIINSIVPEYSNDEGMSIVDRAISSVK